MYDNENFSEFDNFTIYNTHEGFICYVVLHCVIILL